MALSRKLYVRNGIVGLTCLTLLLASSAVIVASPLGGSPPNDQCVNAIAVAVPSSTQGTTIGSTFDSGFQTCGVPVTSPGIWYSVVGTGNTMTASICDGTNYDSRLTIYCNSCDEPTCVGGDEDGCDLQSIVSWCSQPGAVYLILVHGFAADVGDFTLALSDDGVSCDNPVNCTGAAICDNASGSCCDEKGNGTPGCSNPECCAIVCDTDPVCCELEWDVICALEAGFLCDYCKNPPQCPWDLDGSGSVGTSDLLDLLSQWGVAGSADFDGSGEVGTADLLVLLANWGPCP